MPETKSYLYQDIAESVRWRIASGELEAGDRLPPVRRMAETWGCTPGTVSRAYAMLAQEGLVTSRPGSSTRVTPSSLQPHRPAWQWANLINQAEQFLLEAVAKGRTPAQVESALCVAISRWQELQQKEVPPPRFRTDQGLLRFAGSHDLAIETLSRMTAEHLPHVSLSVEYGGSLGGLMALARNEADIAGSHLWDASSDTYNEPFVRRILPGRPVVLFSLAYRTLGLVVSPGNPRGLQSLSDLPGMEGALVNRQPGSGTRVWLDVQLQAMGLDRASISGYENVESTHLAVARAVAEGEATAGIAIQAAAAAYGLDFIPLTQERYDLVMTEEVWQTEATQALVAFVQSPHFKEALASLGGYEPAADGPRHATY